MKPVSKSIYIDEPLHSSLKLLASLEKKALNQFIQESLQLTVKKKLSDLPPEWLEKLALAGQSFEFLQNKKEDLYSDADGEELR